MLFYFAIHRYNEVKNEKGLWEFLEVYGACFVVVFVVCGWWCCPILICCRYYLFFVKKSENMENREPAWIVACLYRYFCENVPNGYLEALELSYGGCFFVRFCIV